MSLPLFLDAGPAGILTCSFLPPNHKFCCRCIVNIISLLSAMNHAKHFTCFILLFCAIWQWITCNILSCFAFLCFAIWLWITILWLFVQLLLLHLGLDKRFCSLMHIVSLCDLLPGYKSIKLNKGCRLVKFKKYNAIYTNIKKYIRIWALPPWTVTSRTATTRTTTPGQLPP